METLNNLAPHFLEGKTIFVAGAGVAGSGFVAGLRKLWNSSWKPPTIVVFDRDPANDTLRRISENYSLSLSCHSESGGLIALQKLDLVDDAFAAAVSGVDASHGFKVWDPDWSERARPTKKPLHGLPTPSIRITRKSLRRLLNNVVEAWGNSSIEWDSQCLEVARLENGKLKVRIQRGKGAQSEVIDRHCDLLVAADGANSKLRAFLRPGDKLQYTGAVLRGGLSTFEAGIPEKPGMNWGFVMGNDNVSCFVSPVDKQTAIWAVGNREPSPLPGIDRTNAEHVQAVILRASQLGVQFQEPFQTMVSRTDPKSVMCISTRDKLPFRHDQNGIEEFPVVFIGDSNHAVSPFAGFGANLALSDAWDLASHMCRATSLAAAVEAYDDLAEPRARGIVESTRRMMQAQPKPAWRSWITWLLAWAGKWVS